MKLTQDNVLFTNGTIKDPISSVELTIADASSVKDGKSSKNIKSDYLTLVDKRERIHASSGGASA